MDLKAVYQQLQERARQNEAFREEFQRDPEGILAREAGVSVEEVRKSFDFLNEEEFLGGIAGGVGPSVQSVNTPGVNSQTFGTSSTSAQNFSTQSTNPGVQGNMLRPFDNKF